MSNIHDVGENYKTLTCSPCNEAFSNAEQLNNPKRTASHKSKSKQSVCKPGQRVFMGKYDCNRHFNTVCPLNPERTVK